jgi:AAA ATPase containing von Willebrand factor type A (vWA) domain
MPDIDTDLESLAEERAIESVSGNPLKDAIHNIATGREEDTGSEQDDEETESEDEVLEVDEQEETEDASEATEETEESKDSEETEDEEADKPKGKTPKLSSVDIPMPNADGSKGPRGTGKIKLDGVPQEAADAMRHYIKQADKLPLVEQQLAVAQEGAQVADFIEADPFSALVMITNARPDAAEEFVKNYVAMNPAIIAKISRGTRTRSVE